MKVRFVGVAFLNDEDLDGLGMVGKQAMASDEATSSEYWGYEK